MAKLNADRDVRPELAVVNGRMTNEKWELREILKNGSSGWSLVQAGTGTTIIAGTLREVFSFIIGAKYISEGKR